MNEIFGNIWDYYESGGVIVVTTNGDINSRGECVMGRGIALQVKNRFPEFPKKLANHIRKHGNNVGYFSIYRIFTFPVKHHWFEKADLNLIERSAFQLKESVDKLRLERVFMVRPGCSNGRLMWEDVKSVIEKHLDDRFLVVDLTKDNFSVTLMKNEAGE